MNVIDELKLIVAAQKCVLQILCAVHLARMSDQARRNFLNGLTEKIVISFLPDPSYSTEDAAQEFVRSYLGKFGDDLISAIPPALD